jgi:DNA-binding NtrC family response regulator
VKFASARHVPAAVVLLLGGLMERRSSYRALVVEDDGAILKLVKIVLEREGFITEGVRTGAAAMELLGAVAYDLLIVDLMLPEIGGEELLNHLGETQPKTLRRVIVTTASPARMSYEFLQRICRLLAKPFDIDQLALIARECADANSGVASGIA